MVEIKNMAPFQSVVAPIPEMPRQSTAIMVFEKATEVLVAVASDREWYQVTEQDWTSAQVEEAPVVVEPVVAGPVLIATPVVVEPVVAAPSDYVIKWSIKLFMVPIIFSGVETSKVMDRL